MARPTKYTPALLKKAGEYIAKTKDIIPMVAGLALYLDISRDTIYEWIKDSDKAEFSDIVEKIMTEQERKLFEGGLSGDFNASITKLALTKHGYTDKTEQDANVKIIHDYVDESV